MCVWLYVWLFIWMLDVFWKLIEFGFWLKMSDFDVLSGFYLLYDICIFVSFVKLSGCVGLLFLMIMLIFVGL